MSLRLYRQLIQLEASKVMSYRGDFWITAIANLLAIMVVTWFLMRAIYDGAESVEIGGFTLPAMMTYLIGVNLIGRVVRGADLQMGIATEIYDGSLNRYLLYPTRYLPLKFAQHFGATLVEILQMFLFTGLIIALLGLPEDSGVTLGTIALTLPALLIANLLYFLLSAPLQYVAFWADNVWSLGVLLRFTSLLLGGAMLPFEWFPDSWVPILRSLPFASCYEFPILIAMGRIEFGWGYLTGLGTGLLWCGILALACLPVWRRGQLNYTGVGI